MTVDHSTVLWDGGGHGTFYRKREAKPLVSPGTTLSPHCSPLPTQPSKECLSQIAWQNWLNLLQTAILFLRGLCVIAWSQGIHHDRGTSWPVSSNVFFMLRKLLKSGLSRMFLSSRRTLCHCILPLSVSPCPCSPHSPPHPFTFLHVLSTLLPLSLGSFSSASGFFSHPLYMLQGTLVLILGLKQ